VVRLLNRMAHNGPTQPRTIGAPRKANRKGTKRDPREQEDRRPRPERPARHERSERSERSERPERSERSERPPRPERPERSDAPRPERSNAPRPERSDAPRPERSNAPRPERSDAPRPERSDAPRPETSERPAHLQTTSSESDTGDGTAPPGRERFAKSVGTSFAKSKRGPRGGDGEFVSYQVSWGEEKGADPRRLLALVCRRGGVDRGDVGAIRVGPRSSTVEVTKDTADRFERAVQKPDKRDAHVRFRRWVPGSQRES
jgi:hypothetical protein